MQRVGVLRSVVTASALAALLATLATSTAAADAVGCGSTLTTDTVLTTDLVGCSDGLTVVGRVTLDLGGHTLMGLGGGTGVHATDGATVTGGTVSGFDRGVSLGEATIQHLTISDNLIGVLADDFPPGEFTVRANRIARNGVGIVMSLGAGVVSGNQVMFNSFDGISNGGAEPVTVEYNKVSKNGGRGIYVQDATTRLIGNTVSHNGSDGIFVSDVYNIFFPYWFSGNVADDNGGYGIAFNGVLTRLDPPASVDGGGNAAKHNVNPAQCLQIVCAFNRGLARETPPGPMSLHASGP